VKLDDRQIELFSRQIILPDLGGIGQRRLLSASCLLIGRGPDLDTSASYLAGAGIGTLHLWANADSPLPPPESTSGSAHVAIAFAPLDDRGPDTEVRILASAPADLCHYDVALIAQPPCPDPAPTRSLTALESIVGAPRLGSIGLLGPLPDRSPGVGLILVPSDSRACLGCTHLDRPRGDEPCQQDPLAPALAGAMAAVVACSWIARLAPVRQLRGLRLAPEDATWVEAPLRRNHPCRRGCRT
jgi:hypothetical protein